MVVFKTRFIYPLYFLLLVIALLSSIFFVIYLYIIIRDAALNQGFSAEDFWYGVLGMFMFGYVAAQFDQIVITLRYGIIITETDIILKDYLFWRERNITRLVKGYSSSYYGYQNDIKCLIIYLEGKRHINMPRYCYLNYSEIEPALIEKKVPFLGNELFVGKYIISRGYQFNDVAYKDK